MKVRWLVAAAAVWATQSCKSWQNLSRASADPVLAPAKSEARRPNLLLVLTDDQRFDALGVAQKDVADLGRVPRAPWLRTPTMDSLARTGIRFRRGYATLALCSPSRAAMLTGQYNHANGVVHNSQDFPTSAQTFASVLKAQGYRTGYFGKWHHGHQRDRPGFDVVVSYEGHGIYTPRLTRPKQPGDDGRYPFHEEGDADLPVLIYGDRDVPKKGFIDDLVAEEVARFVQESKDRPWVAMVGFKSPHQVPAGTAYGPKAVPPRRTATCYADQELTNGPEKGDLEVALADRAPWDRSSPPRPYSQSTMLAYYRSISGVDGSLRRILKALNETGEAKDTVVIYASDNGYFNGEHNLVDKRSAYEESIRVPFIVNYPALMGRDRFEIADADLECDRSGRTVKGSLPAAGPAGLVSDEMVLNIDVAPTFLDFANLGTQGPRGMHGRSLKPLIEQIAARRLAVPVRESFLVAYHHDPEYPEAVPAYAAVVDRRHKYVRYRDQPDWSQLFDLKTDPFETRNMLAAPEKKPVLESLKTRLEEIKKETGFCFISDQQRACPRGRDQEDAKDRVAY